VAEHGTVEDLDSTSIWSPMAQGVGHGTHRGDGTLIDFAAYAAREATHN
jgi:hypothetical protein